LASYVRTKSPSRQVDQCIQAFSAIIASNEEEEDDISAKDRINAEAAACEVALAITNFADREIVILDIFIVN
jgi:hypothetical protein